jgi:hypothetical protein
VIASQRRVDLADRTLRGKPMLGRRAEEVARAGSDGR